MCSMGSLFVGVQGLGFRVQGFGFSGYGCTQRKMHDFVFSGSNHEIAAV